MQGFTHAVTLDSYQLQEISISLPWKSDIGIYCFNILLITMATSFRQKINIETQILQDTLCQIELTDTYRVFHPKEQKTHSSQVHKKQSNY